MSPISIFVSSYYLLKVNRTTLWFTHPGPKFGLKKIVLFLSMLVSEHIVTASPSSFPFKSSKVKVIGHAINLEKFNFSRETFQIRKFLILSRISESKNLEIAIESFLKSEFNNYELDIIGGPLNKDDQEYFINIKNRYESDNIKFLGKMRHDELPAKLLEYDVHFNCAEDGFFDKSILETLSFEIINFYKNKDFNYIFGNDFFNFKNSKDLVIKLNELSNADSKEIFYRLKNIKSVLEKNSLKTLNQRLINYL